VAVGSALCTKASYFCRTFKPSEWAKSVDLPPVSFVEGSIRVVVYRDGASLHREKVVVMVGSMLMLPMITKKRFDLIFTRHRHDTTTRHDIQVRAYYNRYFRNWSFDGATTNARRVLLPLVRSPSIGILCFNDAWAFTSEDWRCGRDDRRRPRAGTTREFSLIVHLLFVQKQQHQRIYKRTKHFSLA
jgi:hypothetical protein